MACEIPVVFFILCVLEGEMSRYYIVTAAK